MTTLTDTLKKLGLRWEDLTPEEKTTYEQYDKVLSDDITVEKITECMRMQINFIENDWANPDNSEKKDAFLKAQMRVLKTLLAFIESPKRSKEQLKQHLKTIT